MTPWAIACLVESAIPALTVGVVCLGHSGALLATLWPIRDELTDVLPHGVGCIAGTATIMATAAAMARADRARADLWSTDDEVAAAFSSLLALGLALVTVLVVLGNLLAGSGPLFHVALFRTTAESRYSQHPMRLKRYHNDFQRPPPPPIDQKAAEERSIAQATAAGGGTGGWDRDGTRGGCRAVEPEARSVCCCRRSATAQVRRDRAQIPEDGSVAARRVWLNTFDTEVSEHSATLIDVTLRARVERWRQAAKQEEYEAAFKEAMNEYEAAFDPDYVPEPDDWLEGAKEVAEAAFRPPPNLLRRCWALVKGGYRAFTQETIPGYYVHCAERERQLFGRRLRLTPECLARIGRVPPPPEPQLPEGWQTTQDEEGSTYFWNVNTSETTWDEPQIQPDDDGAVAEGAMIDEDGLVYFAESLPGATTIYDDDLSHPSRKAKMRPEHRHLTMHHREPIVGLGKKPQPSAEAVVHAEHHSFEVQEHEHELAKRNGSHAKAVFDESAADAGERKRRGAQENHILVEGTRRGGEESVGGRPKLPPLKNPTKIDGGVRGAPADRWVTNRQAFTATVGLEAVSA